MYADDFSPCFCQRLSVALRLRGFERAEREGGFFFSDIVGNINVRRKILRQLNEQAVSGIALVQLPGGMQIARTVSAGHRQSISAGENFT